MSVSATDWVAWHRAYEDPTSSLSHRLRVVQDQIRRALPEHSPDAFRVLSLCAGRGQDLISVLREYPHADRVRTRLIELDPRNLRAMAAAGREAGIDLEIVSGDAADPALYEGAVPADLVLLCGVLGNISDQDVRSTLLRLPELCTTGATVIWTRSRRPPDLTPAIRRWLGDAGFTELAFVAPDGELFSVGANRFAGAPRPLGKTRLFTFIR